MSQGESSLSEKTLDIIYDRVLENLKTCGKFDEMRVDLLELASSDPQCKTIMDTFMESYIRRLNLDQDRKILRSNLDKDFHDDFRVKISFQAVVESVISQRLQEIQVKFMSHAEEFLRKEFLASSPTHETKDESNHHKSPASLPDDVNQIEQDMDLESSYGDFEESPKAPEFSPISIDANDSEYLETRLEESKQLPQIACELDMTYDNKPSLENIPIPDEIPIPSDEPPTPVQDEPPRDEVDSDEDDENQDGTLTFSSVSTPGTNDLTDFEDAVNLSDDEAKIVGQPIKSRMKIEELQKNINGLDTKEIDCDPQTREVSASILPCETSESDACSESATAGRRVGRQRKSNPRYSSEDFTS